MSKRNRCKPWIDLVVTSALTAGVCTSAVATGFAIPLQNVTNLGTGYAGTAALAEDASTAFYNSAGLTRLTDEQIAASAILIDARTHLQVTNATGDTGASLGGGLVKPTANGLVPALHYMKRINRDWAFGLSVVAPFGLKMKYKDNSLVRYTSTNSQLATYNIGPSLAYDMGNGVSIGVGPDFLFGTARLDAQLNTLGVSEALDGFDHHRASGFGIGGHAGIHVEAFEGATRVGLNYQSNVRFKASGEETRYLAVNAVPPVFLTTRQGVTSRINFPEKVVFSAYQGLFDRFAIMADVEWIRWNRFQNLTLNYADGSQVIIPELYKNGWRFALGGSYQIDDRWRFRLGGSYEKSPTRDSTRSINIPDSNRWATAVGGQYRILDCLALEFAYSFAYQRRAKITDTSATVLNPPPGAPAILESVDGYATTRSHVAGLQLSWDIR